MKEPILEISDESSTPKYKQIFNAIIEKIEAGVLKHGEKLPSINNVSFDYFLARDTVEKAYNELKKEGIIEAVKGKGYYVKNANPTSRFKVLVLFNKLSAYKKVIFNTMAHNLGEKAHIDLFIYHCNYELFEKILRERMTGYSCYVIMPHFINYELRELQSLLAELPKEKVVLLDHAIEGLAHYKSLIYQDFKMDISEALTQAQGRLNKYNEVVLVFPENQNYPYPKEIITGFRRYCTQNKVNYAIINELKLDKPLKKNVAYVIIEENDLVALIKRSRLDKLQLGKDIGVISYNDTPLKEVLEDGISVITTDFEEMGKLAAQAVEENKTIAVKNNFKLIVRNTL